MKTKNVLLGLLLSLAGAPLQAQVTEHYSFSPGLVIPDGNGAGSSDARLVSGSSIPVIGSLSVDLNVAGNFNGDLYLYLRHEEEVTPGAFVADAFVVLLNRLGRAIDDLFGYDDSGFDVTLSDGAANGDIHKYRTVSTPNAGSPLSGTWQPDGRNVDPTLSFDTTPRTTLLNAFNGKNANGRWTLFGADIETGGTSEINSWQLNFTAVPEPQHWALATGIGLIAFAAWRRYLL